MNEDHDPILDACLDELLGGRTPPDLSQRILREWSHRAAQEICAGQESSVAQESAATPVSPELILPPVCPAESASPWCATNLSTEPVSRRINRVLVRRDRRLINLVSVALALGLIVVISIAGMLQFGDDRQSAEQLPRPPVVPAVANHKPAVPLPNPTESAVEPVVNPTVPKPLTTPSVVATSEPRLDSQVERSPIADPESQPAANAVIAASLPTAASDLEIVERINRAIRDQWMANKLAVPDFVSNQDWHRRAFRVVLGRDPTEEEKKRFRDDDPDGRSKLLAALTSSEDYLEEFARHWSEFLTDAFLPADLLDAGSLAHRDGMLQFFRRSLLDRQPFDRIATQLLTAQGSGLPGSPDYDGATNFLLARAGGKLEHATADTARLLLGRTIECQQCHADPRDERRRQQEFWELNTFFRQLVATRPAGTPAAKISDADFLGEDKQDGRNAIVFYELPDGVLKGAFPSFPGLVDLPKSGIVAEVNRRELLARCVANSPDFRRALTNRFWSAVLGHGLAPLEDLESGDPPRLELLADLADQFAAHQFDPRRLITWVVLSEPFSAPEADASFASSSALSLFHRFQTPRRVQRPDVHQSLLAAAKSLGQPSSNSAAAAKVDESPKNIGKNGKVVVEPPSPSRSLFSNTANYSADPLVRKILSDQRMSTTKKAEHLFQLVVHRMPRRRELEIVDRMIQQTGDKREAAWEAVWTSLQEP